MISPPIGLMPAKPFTKPSAGTAQKASAVCFRLVEIDGACSSRPLAEVDRYIGYWEPYATSHVAYENDQAFQEEVRNAARTLSETVVAKRQGQQIAAGSRL